MERIRAFEQYKEAVSTARSRGYRLSNCFFLPAAIKQKIADETLFYLWIENGLLLLDDCVDFYRCYYYLHSTAHPVLIALDKDAVIEFPFNGSLSTDQQEQVQRIETMGFRLGRESGMMVASPEQLKDNSVYDSQKTGKICSADISDVDQIINLLHLSFNPLFAFLPNQDELAASIKAGRVLVIRSEDHSVDAVLSSTFERGIASIRQVAVAPCARGQGLGRSIVKAYHRKYMGEAKQFQHWVDLNNTTAMNMYRRLGYEFSLRRANEYINLISAKNE